MAFTTVEGTISRVFYNGTGAEVTESFKKRDGTEGKKRWTLWFEAAHGLNEGDTGSWRGSHSDEVDDWADKEGQTRHSVKRALNKVKASGDRAASGAGTASTGSQARQDAPDAEPWSNPAPVASDGGNDWTDTQVPF